MSTLFDYISAYNMHKIIHLAVSPLTKTINKEILPHTVCWYAANYFCLKLSIALLFISTIQATVLYLLGCIPPCSVLGLSVRPDLETLIVELLPLSAGKTGVRFCLFFFLGSTAITGSSANSSSGPFSPNNSLGSSVTSCTTCPGRLISNDPR